jgi:hypothetical protein
MRVVAGVACLVLSFGSVGQTGAAEVPAELKEPIRGLLDRTKPATGAYEPVVDGFVIRVTWSELQPDPEPGTDHGSALDTASIDRALSAVHAAGNPVRLRVSGGIHAPQWAKRLGGAEPVTWYADGTVIGTVGRFWTSQYGAAYQNLQHRLAERYDDDPRVGDVVISRCTTEFAEPYVRQTGQLSLLRPGLQAAGYTGAADDQCHREEIDAHRVWQRTRSYLAFNPYQRIHEDTWTHSVDTAFTMRMIDHCRQVLGPRCVLGNNSLGPDRPQTYQDMYEYIAAKGGPISLQTATAAKVCGGQHPCPAAAWNMTLDLAVRYGAGAVELPGGAAGYTTWAIEEVPPHHGLRYYDDALERAAVVMNSVRTRVSSPAAGVLKSCVPCAVPGKTCQRRGCGDMSCSRRVSDWSTLGSFWLARNSFGAVTVERSAESTRRSSSARSAGAASTTSASARRSAASLAVTMPPRLAPTSTTRSAPRARTNATAPRRSAAASRAIWPVRDRLGERYR